MSPHSDHLNNISVFKYFINQSVLDIDSTRICPSKVADQFFVGGMILKEILT